MSTRVLRLDEQDDQILSSAFDLATTGIDMDFYSSATVGDGKVSSQYNEVTGLGEAQGGMASIDIGGRSKDDEETRLFEEFISLVEPSKDLTGCTSSATNLYTLQAAVPSSHPTYSHPTLSHTHPSHSLLTSSHSAPSSLVTATSLHQGGCSRTGEERENIYPGMKRRISGSFGKGVKLQNIVQSMKNEESLLRQQLMQGKREYRSGSGSVSESCQCPDCGRTLTAKCILKTCLKSDEVLCTTCGRELTTKCILGSCMF